MIEPYKMRKERFCVRRIPKARIRIRVLFFILLYATLLQLRAKTTIKAKKLGSIWPEEGSYCIKRVLVPEHGQNRV